jgi:hypothetical protein
MTGSKKNNKDPKADSNVTDEKDVEHALRIKNPNISRRKAKDIAKDAMWVVNNLDIKDFIDDHWPKISQKLIECEKFAREVRYGPDMMFVSMAIPLVNGIIHVASTRDKLIKTTKYFSDEWKRAGIKEPEKVPIVSALTLIYLVSKGLDTLPQGDKTAATLWEDMNARVQHLSSDNGGTNAPPG